MSDFAYIAVEPCGCVTAATVDLPEYQKENAKEIGKWVRGGRRVERVSVDEARERLTPKWPCEHVTRERAGVSDDAQLALETA